MTRRQRAFCARTASKSARGVTSTTSPQIRTESSRLTWSCSTASSSATRNYERLLEAAAEHARRLLVFSYPRRNAVSRFLISAQNLFFWLRRMEFRTFAHPPARMLAAVEGRGLHHTYAHHPLVWQIAGFER
jgi:hypothetical protein